MTKRTRFKEGTSELVTALLVDPLTSTLEGRRRFRRRIMEIISLVEERKRYLRSIFSARISRRPPFFFFFLSLHLDYNEIKKSAEQQSVRFWKDLAEGGFVERKEGWKRKVENKSGDSSGWVTRAGP